MFFTIITLASSVLLVSTVSSSALPSPLNPTSNSLNQPADFGTLTTNSSSLQDLASPLLSYSPDCSIQYGRNLRYASCDNALAKISQVTTSMTFGERATGNWDVVLPQRYLSGKFLVHSSKFHCYSMPEPFHSKCASLVQTPYSC